MQFKSNDQDAQFGHRIKLTFLKGNSKNYLLIITVTVILQLQQKRKRVGEEDEEVGLSICWGLSGFAGAPPSARARPQLGHHPSS